MNLQSHKKYKNDNIMIKFLLVINNIKIKWS